MKPDYACSKEKHRIFPSLSSLFKYTYNKDAGKVCGPLSLELVLTIVLVLGLNAVNIDNGGIVPIILHVQCMLITV